MKQPSIIIVAVLSVVLLFVNLNFFKTLYLIARVSPAYEQKGTDDKTLLILGDSTGYGTGASGRTESVAGLIGAAYPELTIINQSENGRTAKKLRRDIQKLEGKYDTILLQIGANDLLRHTPTSEVVAEIEGTAVYLRKHTDRVLVLTSGNIGAAPRFSVTKRAVYTDSFRIYDQLMQSQAMKTGSFTFVSQFKEPENDPFVLEPEKNFSMDGLHPSSAGYALWFEALKPRLSDT